MKSTFGLLWFCVLWLAQANSQSIFDSKAINEVRITFDKTEWQQQLADHKMAGQEDRMLADLSLNGQSYKNVGIRYKGNSSFHAVMKTEARKLPLNIKVNFVDKSQRLPGGGKTLKLANGFRDPSFIREVLAYDIARQYMPASRASYAKVYANDHYLGLYTLVESVDNSFLDENFGDHNGVFFKCDPNYNIKAPATCPEGSRASLTYLGEDTTCYKGYYEIQSDTGWHQLVHLTKTLNENLGAIEEILDVDQTLWMLAFNNYLVNLDSYLGAFCHNYYLYQDKEGIFHPIIWDMNLAFGGFRLVDDNVIYNEEQLKRTSMLLHFKENNEKRPLVTYLLRNELYRKVYFAHLKTIYEDQTSDSLVYKRALELHDHLRKEVQEDQNKLYTDEMFEASLNQSLTASKAPIIGLFDLLDGRHDYLGNHIVLKRETPSISSIDHKKIEDSVQFEVVSEQAQKVWLCYRTINGRSFKRVLMDKGNAEIGWTASIPHHEDLQYYIIAEGRYNVTLSPRRASFEFHTLKDSE
ncbi:MAG: CotH kinase family protein [Bacteroidota bacterium]